MTTEIQRQITVQNKSILTRLLNILLFEQIECVLIEQSSIETSHYMLSDGCERLVFANGDLNPDDELYIYECLWKYSSETTILEKMKLLMIYIDSDEAEILIDHKMEQEDFNSQLDEDKLEDFAKLEIFKWLSQEIFAKNIFPVEITIWLFKKCSSTLWNMSEGPITEENYEEIILKFEA